MAAIQDRTGQLNFQINAINAQLKLFKRFKSNDRKTERNIRTLQDRRAALQVQIDNEVTWPPNENEIPF